MLNECPSLVNLVYNFMEGILQSYIKKTLNMALLLCEYIDIWMEKRKRIMFPSEKRGGTTKYFNILAFELPVLFSDFRSSILKWSVFYFSNSLPSSSFIPVNSIIGIQPLSGGKGEFLAEAIEQLEMYSD